MMKFIYLDILAYKSYIELLAAVGTFISALIAVYTLYEIKKQRQSTYKPELFLDTFCYFVLDNPLLDGNKLNKFRVSTYNEDNAGKKEEENIFVSYKLENLGFGFAKSIECEWEFDYKEALNQINNIMPSEYKSGRLLQYYTINADPDFQKSFNPEDLSLDKFDFIQPSSSGENRKKLSFPKIIIDTYLYFLLFKYNLTKETGKSFYFEDFKNMPKIKLKLKYRDLANKIYYKTLKLRIECACTQVNDDDILITNQEFAVFYVKVEE